MRRLFFILTAGLFAILPASAGTQDLAGARSRPLLRWPNPLYRTLQEAVDAAPDGAILDIHAGTYDLAEPLRVTGKRLLIQGAGSGIPDRRGRIGNVTHLRGPRPTRAGDQGGISYVGAGGALRHLRISGFDAGISARADERGFSFPLMVQDAAIADSGHGIYWSAPVQLTLIGSNLQGLLGNGLWVLNGMLKLFNVEIADVDQIGLYLTAPVDGGFPDENIIVGATVSACHIGIAVFQSAAVIFGSKISFCIGGGIWAVYAEVQANANLLFSNGTVGIGAVNAAVNLFFNMIVFTLSVSNGQWGDGIALVADQFPSIATIVGNTVANSDRAGISSFGSIVFIQGNVINDSAFSLEGEPYKGYAFQFTDGGGNTANDGDDPPNVLLTSVGLSPPGP